jgi:VanZ family protein
VPKLTTRAFVIYWLPVILWLGVIFMESVSIFAASDHTSRFIVPFLRWLMPHADMEQLETIHHLLRKLGHFTGYGLMGYFFFRAVRGTYHALHGTAAVLTRAYRRSAVSLAFSQYWRSGWMLAAMLGTFLVASADELHQMTLANRTGSWWDVLLDCIGGLGFQVLLFVFWQWRTRATRVEAARARA